MILVDSNIPMYLVGASHTHKIDAQQTLERLLAANERLVTDVEVFQEILHRYRAIDRRDAIQPAFDVLGAVVDEIFPIEVEDAETAKAILLARWSLSARDAIHVAVMQHRGVQRILSFDRGFDRVPGIARLG